MVKEGEESFKVGKRVMSLIRQAAKENRRTIKAQAEMLIERGLEVSKGLNG